jgi:hypothetical protein
MGASGLFAHQLPKGVAVTVLCRPPPQRLHPQGSTTYQSIEEPVLKGILGGAAVSCIEMAHSTVEGAEAYRYQVWPTDEADEWTRRYGNNRLKNHMRKGSKRYTAQVPSMSICTSERTEDKIVLAKLPPKSRTRHRARWKIL